MTLRPSDLVIDPADRAALLLGLLGSTPAAVAMSLACLGHRGTRSSRACPIWTYLGENGIPVERVDSYDVTLCQPPLDARLDFLTPPVRVALPGPVVGFIQGFDDGRWPDLVAK